MVNVNDFQDVDLEKIKEEYGGDLLEAMFNRQKILMNKYEEIEAKNGGNVVLPENFGELNDRLVQMRLKECAYRVVEELSEATNCLKNKPWKSDAVETDEVHYKEELADTFHFFLELLITSGFTFESFAEYYFRKAEVNKFRQDSGY